MRKLIQHRVALINGLLGAAGLLAFYFIVLRATNPTWDHAIENFLKLWPWLLLLDLGFGMQVGLYSCLHKAVRNSPSGKIASTSAGISAASMIACCAHHLADVLPIIALAGVTLFLAEYQIWFIFIGIISNLLGIFYLLQQIRKLNLNTRSLFSFPSNALLKNTETAKGVRNSEID